MIRFTPSLPEDEPQILEWMLADSYHVKQLDYSSPGWWTTGNGLLAFCLQDDIGPLTYVRLDEEGEYIRIHTQFAPESVVSKRRLVIGVLECLKALTEMYKSQKKKGFVFQSISPKLIAFMKKYQGFESIGNDDYRVEFEGII